jgi:TRAP-type C4-dicarboxylate transport system substrate-binding protein
MNRRILLYVIIAMFSIFSVNAAAITIKLGSLAPTGSPWDKALNQLGAEWDKISGGSVSLKIYSGGIVGDEADMIRKMRIGQLNAAGITGMGLCKIYPDVFAVQLPLLIRTNDELNYVLEKMKPTFSAELEKRGTKVLIWTFVGWVHFFSKTPVSMPADLQKQKLFVWSGDPEAVQTWKETGFNVVPLTPTDIMPSLQSGMIEAFSTTPLSAASYQWFGLAKNMCEMRWAPLIGGIVVSMNTWNKIPPDIAAKLEASATQVGNNMQDEILKADNTALDIMKKNGLVINPISKTAYTAWEAVVEGGKDKGYMKSIDPTVLATIKKYLEEYRQTAKPAK